MTLELKGFIRVLPWILKYSSSYFNLLIILEKKVKYVSLISKFPTALYTEFIIQSVIIVHLNTQQLAAVIIIVYFHVR